MVMLQKILKCHALTRFLSLAACILLINLCMLITPVLSFSILQDKDLTLDGNIEIGAGVFHSSEDYSLFAQQRGAVNWQEGYIKAGLSGHTNSWYGGLSALGSGTTGAGDVHRGMNARLCWKMPTSVGRMTHWTYPSAARILCWGMVFSLQATRLVWERVCRARLK